MSRKVPIEESEDDWNDYLQGRRMEKSAPAAAPATPEGAPMTSTSIEDLENVLKGEPGMGAVHQNRPMGGKDSSDCDDEELGERVEDGKKRRRGEKVEKGGGNPNHRPAGDEHGGEFAPKDGGDDRATVSGDLVVDTRGRLVVAGRHAPIDTHDYLAEVTPQERDAVMEALSVGLHFLGSMSKRSGVSREKVAALLTQWRKDGIVSGSTVLDGRHKFQLSRTLQRQAEIASRYGDPNSPGGVFRDRSMNRLFKPVQKADPADFELEVPITKYDEERGQTFGIFSVSKVGDDLVVDGEGDRISPDELEKMAHGHLREYRKADVNHDEVEVAELIESLVLTPEKCAALEKELRKQGIPATIDIPAVVWVGGHQVHSAEVKKDIREGRLESYSIGGTARRVPVEKMNPNHEPAGSPKGGQFAAGTGGKRYTKAQIDVMRHAFNAVGPHRGYEEMAAFTGGLLDASDMEAFGRAAATAARQASDEASAKYPNSGIGTTTWRPAIHHQMSRHEQILNDLLLEKPARRRK